MALFCLLAVVVTCGGERPRSRGGILLSSGVRQLDADASKGHSLAQLPDIVITSVSLSEVGEAERMQKSPEPSTPLADAVRDALAKGPLETVARNTEALAAESLGVTASVVATAESARMSHSKVAAASAAELRKGELIGAVFALGTTLEEELEADNDAGPARGICMLLVFVVPAVCWILELILAKFWDTQEKQDEASEVSEARPFLHALSFARYLVAWHVVINHFAFGGSKASQQTGAWADFVNWGVLAAPWFFMVSGFTNSFSKLVSPPQQRRKQEDFIHAMVRRASSWYPFYLIALIWCAIRLTSTDAEDWAHFTASSMMINGWVWNAPTFPFLNLHSDMWLSWLIPYMLTWAPVHSALDEGSEQSTDSIIWTIFVMSVLIVIPSTILEWIWFAEFPFYSMIQLWPSFIFGQALAFWYVKNCMEEQNVMVGVNGVQGQLWVRKQVTDIPLYVRFGVTIGVLVFGVVFFSFSPLDNVPLFGKPALPIFQKGLQLPLQGLMVIALASEIDPISKLFARKPFRFAEKLTLMTYIFQVPVYNTLHGWTGWEGLTWTFAGTLVAFTIVAHYLLERPYRQWRGDRERGEARKENLTAGMK